MSRRFDYRRAGTLAGAKVEIKDLSRGCRTLISIVKRPPPEGVPGVNALGSLKKGIASPRPILPNTNLAASTLQQDYIAPDAAKQPDPLAATDLSKTAAFVQRDAGGVFGKYPRLQCPQAVSFGFID